MAKNAKMKFQKSTRKTEVFPFERQNYIIIGIGILLIVAGYLALTENTVEGFLPLTVAPILLVLGYCVVIPLGILYTRKPEKRSTENPSTAA